MKKVKQFFGSIKNLIITLILLIVCLAFTIGYSFGFSLSDKKTIENKEPTAYELLQEGYKRLEGN